MFIRPRPPSPDGLAGHAGGGGSGSARGTTSPLLHKGWVCTGSMEKEMLLITFTYSCQI